MDHSFSTASPSCSERTGAPYDDGPLGVHPPPSVLGRDHKTDQNYDHWATATIAPTYCKMDSLYIPIPLETICPWDAINISIYSTDLGCLGSFTFGTGLEERYGGVELEFWDARGMGGLSAEDGGP